MNLDPLVVVGLTLALAASAATAQTFIIVTPEGARLSSSPPARELRFDDPAVATPAVGAALAGAAGTARDDARQQAGATLPATGTPTAWPRAGSLNLTLDVQRFLPAPPPLPVSRAQDENPTAAAGSVASAASPAGTPVTALAGAEPRPARAARDDSDDLALKFNVRGFSLLEVDGAADTRLQFRRVREREWRKPTLSLTLQKKF